MEVQTDRAVPVVGGPKRRTLQRGFRVFHDVGRCCCIIMNYSGRARGRADSMLVFVLRASIRAGISMIRPPSGRPCRILSCSQSGADVPRIVAWGEAARRPGAEISVFPLTLLPARHQARERETGLHGLLTVLRGERRRSWTLTVLRGHGDRGRSWTLYSALGRRIGERFRETPSRGGVGIEGRRLSRRPDGRVGHHEDHPGPPVLLAEVRCGWS